MRHIYLLIGGFWSICVVIGRLGHICRTHQCVCYSSGLSAYLASSHDGSRLCQFSITQYACAEVHERFRTHRPVNTHSLSLSVNMCLCVCCVQLTVLSAQDLVTVLLCSLNLNEDVSIETWKLFTQKVNPVLGPALDLLANTVHDNTLASVFSPDQDAST